MNIRTSILLLCACLSMSIANQAHASKKHPSTCKHKNITGKYFSPIADCISYLRGYVGPEEVTDTWYILERKNHSVSVFEQFGEDLQYRYEGFTFIDAKNIKRMFLQYCFNEDNSSGIFAGALTFAISYDECTGEPYLHGREEWGGFYDERYLGPCFDAMGREEKCLPEGIRQILETPCTCLNIGDYVTEAETKPCFTCHPNITGTYAISSGGGSLKTIFYYYSGKTVDSVQKDDLWYIYESPIGKVSAYEILDGKVRRFEGFTLVDYNNTKRVTLQYCKDENNSHENIAGVVNLEVVPASCNGDIVLQGVEFFGGIDKRFYEHSLTFQTRRTNEEIPEDILEVFEEPCACVNASCH